MHCSYFKIDDSYFHLHIVSSLFQSQDIERIGRDFHLHTVLLGGDETLHWIDIGRIVDGILLQTILGRETNQLAILDILALEIYLGSGMLCAGIGYLDDDLASLLIEGSGREDA